jgi:excisionase family DNA binding protein
MERDEWLTIEEAAKYLKLSIPAIRKYISNGKLKHYRNGRIIRIKKSDLDSFLKPSEPRTVA